MRSLSQFQSWELAAFDLLMRSRPLETEDSRILIIGATEQDLKTYGYPLPDVVLARLLDKIQQYQPSAIGLDIVRDNPVPKQDLEGHQAFALHLKKNEKLITVCTFDTNLVEAIAPPSATPSIQLGFVNLYDDREFNPQDDTIRRYLLSRSTENHSEICPSTYSFAWQLIYLYLEDKGIAIKTVKDNWQFGSLVTKRLQKRSGGYQNLDARGNQLLINYRHTRAPQKIAQQVALGDILNQRDNFDPTLIKERVVLIGVTASSVQDWHDTPYSEMRGIYIHAHTVSQILSAVEDKRPLLWWLPWWGDICWVWLWSFMGGLIIWRFRTLLNMSIAIGILLIVVYGFCWIIFIQGGWLPLIPSALGLLATGGSLASLIRWRHLKIRR